MQKKTVGADDEDRSKELIRAKTMKSALSVATMDAYDPYEYRTSGHLSNFQAWAHLVKCSFGTGVLTMPMGFKHAGMIPGFVIGVLIGGFCIYCIQILIKSTTHIAARERVPYIPFDEVMKYTFEHGYPLCKPLSRCMKTFTDTILVAYHFGICVAYVNYISQSSLIICGYGDSREGYNWPTVIATLSLIPIVCAMNCIKNLKYLAPVSIVGNILTAISMSIIVFHIFRPSEQSFGKSDWEYFGSFQTIPLFIGIILFAVEAFGVVIAVERDMKTPKHFVGWFGVFDLAMFLVVFWYLFLGAAGYLRFGSEVKSTISLTMPSDEWSSMIMYVMIALSILCSYPLHCYVCIDIVWNRHIQPKLKSEKLWLELMFRCGAVILSALISLSIPQLDLIVSLIGAICLSFLGIMMPGIMEYNVAWSKYGAQWSATMIKDIGIATLGFVAFIVGTYGCLYTLIIPVEHQQGKQSDFTYGNETENFNMYILS